MNLLQRLIQAAEAVLKTSGSMGQTQVLIQQALDDKLASFTADGMRNWDKSPWVRELFDDTVVYDYERQTWRASYSIDRTGENPMVTFGEPEKVEVAYVKASEDAPSWMQRFLEKFRELLTRKAADGDLSQEDLDSAMRQARSHVGGLASGAKRRADKEAVEGNKMNAWKLLSELSLSEDGKTARVQIFPAVGTYTHPRYGELDISTDFLKSVKTNFDQKIYQQELPLTIDLEHETKLSGAAGWITDLEIKGDTGMWATVEFNDRGKSLVADDAYRYFSPEFYDAWQDPATAAEHVNVLIGGALTNRPFFKGMQAVVMASEGLYAFSELAESEKGEMPDADDMADMMDQMEAMMAMMSGMMGKGMDKAKMAELGDMMNKLKKQMPKGMPPKDDEMGMAENTEEGTEGPADVPERELAETRTEDGQEYTKGDYLYVPDDMPSHWKLRVAEYVDGAKQVTKAQLGRAAAALGKGFRGNPVELEPDDKQAAITKLKGLYAKMGVKPEDMPAMRASLMEDGLSEDEASAALAVVQLAENDTGGKTVGMTDDESRQFVEMREQMTRLSEQLAEHKTAKEAAEAEVRRAHERVALLEREANRKFLTEFVRGHRLAFQGEVSECVDRLEGMQAKLGADFQDYLDEKKSLHERLQATDLFRTVGVPRASGEGGAADEIAALKSKAMSEVPGMTDAQALEKVLREHPTLYERYNRAHNSRAVRQYIQEEV